MTESETNITKREKELQREIQRYRNMYDECERYRDKYYRMTSEHRWDATLLVCLITTASTFFTIACCTVIVWAGVSIGTQIICWFRPPAAIQAIPLQPLPAEPQEAEPMGNDTDNKTDAGNNTIYHELVFCLPQLPTGFPNIFERAGTLRIKDFEQFCEPYGITNFFPIFRSFECQPAVNDSKVGRICTQQSFLMQHVNMGEQVIIAHRLKTLRKIGQFETQKWNPLVFRWFVFRNSFQNFPCQVHVPVHNTCYRHFCKAR